MKVSETARKLIDEYADAMFDCGDWDEQTTGVPYQMVCDQAWGIRRKLETYIAALEETEAMYRGLGK